MENLGTTTTTEVAERTIEDSVAAHPSNKIPVFRGAPEPERSEVRDTATILDSFGAMVIGLANGVSVRHGIDALRISDTGGEVDSSMSRSEVFEQVKRVESPLTLSLSVSPGEIKNFMQQRRESYLEFLGMTKEDVAENRELLNKFVITQSGEDALEHILFGSTRYEDLQGEGVLTLQGLHFLPTAEKIGLDVSVTKERPKDLGALQKSRGVRKVDIVSDGVQKVRNTIFPESYIDETGQAHEVRAIDVIKHIGFALDNAQTVTLSRFYDEETGEHEGEHEHIYNAGSERYGMPSMFIATDEEGKIMTAFPDRR